MSVVNAGTAKGALVLEDQFSDALDKFDSGMKDAKESAREMSRSTEAAEESTEDFLESVREAARGLEAEARAAIDAEEGVDTLGEEVKETARDTEKLTKEAKAAAAALEKEKKEANDLKNEFGGMKDLFKATAAGFGITIGIENAIGAVKNFAMETMALGGKIKDLAERAGVGVEEFQELEYAITQTGGKTEDVEKVITKLNDKLTEGKSGTVAALRSMGLELETIQNMKPGDAFFKVAENIAKIPDPMKQSQVALELFGTSGAKWLPAIKGGLSELREEAKELGQVLSEEDIAALDEFGDRYDQTMKRLQVSSATAALVIVDGFKSSWKEITQSFMEEIKGLDVTSISAAFGRAIANEGLKRRSKEQEDIVLDPMDDPATAAAYRKQQERIEAQAKAMKEAETEAKSWAKTVQAAYDKAVGKDVQEVIKRTTEVLSRLTVEQRNNKKVVQELLKPYEDVRDKIDDLPPQIEKVRNELGKRLPTNQDLFENISFSLSKLKPNIQNTQLQMNMLRADGLLPVHDVTGKVAEAMDTLYLSQKRVIIETKTMGEVFQETFEQMRIGERIIDSIADSLREGGGLAETIGGVAHVINDGVTQAVTSIAKSNMGSMIGGIVGGIYGQVVGFMIDELTNEFDDSWKDLVQQARVARNDILNQFGGSQREMDRQLDRAGVNPLTQSKIRNARDPEILAKEWETAREALTKYRNEIEGLGSALDGVALIGEATFKSFNESAKKQMDERLAQQKLVIDAMEKEGATEADLAARKQYFAELNKGAILSATDTQINEFNRLGTVAGGVIANIAGRTGDLVGAFRAASETLDPMLEISRQFDLTGKLDPATQEVLRFYGVIKDNADVFTTVQGVGQVLNGLGEAAVNNVELVNALGGSLEDSALKLQAAGVSVTDIYAMLSPQLQELWETVEDGDLVVDETTRSLLDQAEAQGVVGDKMRDTNEQILMVLKEIRDMFVDDLPAAVDEFSDHVRNNNEQTGNAIRRTAQDARRDWTDEMKKQYATWEEENRRAAERVSTDLRNKIPKDWLVDVKWEIDPLQLPDPEPYRVPVEYEEPTASPGGGGAHHRNEPPVPPGGDPYTGAAVQRPGEASARGTTTFILEDAGAPLVRVTAENIPGYVRLRGGNMVHSV